jgi:hypothetical protein
LECAPVISTQGQHTALVSDTDEAQAATDSEGQHDEDKAEERHDAAASHVPVPAACQPPAHATSGSAAAGQLPHAGMFVSTSSQRSMAAAAEIKGAVPCAAGLQLQAGKAPDAGCAELLAALPTARLREEHHSNSSSTFSTSFPAGNSCTSGPTPHPEAQQQQLLPATPAATQSPTDPASMPVPPASSASCAAPAQAQRQQGSAEAPSTTVGLIGQDASQGRPDGVHAAVTAGTWQPFEGTQGRISCAVSSFVLITKPFKAPSCLGNFRAGLSVTSRCQQ